MTDPAERGTTPASAERGLSPALVALGALVLGLHLLAPALLPPALWGARTWFGLPLGWRLLLVVVAGGALLCPRPFDALFTRAPAGRGLRGARLATALALLVLLRSQTLWGNAEIAANAAARGEIWLKHALVSLLGAGLARGLSGITDSPAVGGHALAALSVAAGVAYLLGAAALGRAAFPGDRVKARLVLALLASAGLVQQFFGVIETYAPAAAAQLWTLVLLVRTCSDDERVALRSPIPLLLLAGVTTGMFVATVFLWPAVALAVWTRRAALARPARAALALLAAAGPLLVAAAAVHVGSRGWEAVAEGFGGHDGNAWVPLAAPAGADTVHFTLLSREHLAARLNAALLCAPAWPLLALAWIEARGHADRGGDALGGRAREALALAAAGALSFFVLVHPDMGPTRDWMQGATGALAPYVALIVLTLRRLDARSALLLGVAGLLLSVAHTLPWVLVNAGVP